MAATQIEEIASRLLAGKRKKLLRTRPLFEPFEQYHRPKSASGTDVLVPGSVEALLTRIGYGDIAEVLSFRSEWMHEIDRGPLAGHVIFGQDDSGNHYACSAASDDVHFLSRRSPEYALMAGSLVEFFEQLEQRKFALEDWTGRLELKSYDWT